MNSSSNKKLLSLAAVAGLALSAVGGGLLRERMEIGADVKSPPVLLTGNQADLLASNENLPAGMESDLFFRIQELLEQYYFEEVKDRQKLAIGGVKGMVGSLADPDAVFFDKEHYVVYNEALKGHYQGIGVELRYKYDDEVLSKYRKARAEWMKAREEGKPLPEIDVDPSSLVPDIEVSTVMPGSPAEQAGIKAGDIIDSVDGKSAVSSRMRHELDDLLKEIRSNKVSNERAKELIGQYDSRIENSISPSKVMERVSSGTTGSIELVWLAGGDSTAIKKAKVTRTALQLKAVERDGDAIKLRFFTGCEGAFREAISGKSSFKLDLRNVPNGDPATVKACLATLLPTGSYGYIRNARLMKTTPFSIDGGNDNKATIDILLDRGSSPQAVIFASCLVKAGVGKIQASPGVSQHLAVVQKIDLPDGSGYLLPIGTYSMEEPK